MKKLKSVKIGSSAQHPGRFKHHSVFFEYCCFCIGLGFQCVIELFSNVSKLHTCEEASLEASPKANDLTV